MPVRHIGWRRLGAVAIDPLAPALDVVRFVFFRRHLLKLGRAHQLAIFIENLDVWQLLSEHGRRLERQRCAVVALHELLNGLSRVD
jgi:hypothetical protein